MPTKGKVRAACRIQMAWRCNKARERTFENAQSVVEKIYDPRSGGYYYYNTRTMRSMWVKPKYLGSLDILEVAPTYTREQAAIMMQCQLRRFVGHQRARRKLAKHLSKVVDESTNSFYYYNDLTGEASWEKPKLLGTYDLEDFKDEEESDKGEETPDGEGKAEGEGEGAEGADGDKTDGEQEETKGKEREDEEEEDEESDYESSGASSEDSLLERVYPRSKAQLLVDELKGKYREAGEMPEDSDEEEEQKQRAEEHQVLLARAGGVEPFQLHMHGLGANRITSRVYEVERLRVLNLSDNKLKRLSDDIGNLVMLETLNVSRNKLKTLPVELENMKGLSHLDASHNRIAGYKANLYVCRALRHLDLSHNRMEKVPLSIGDLDLLKVLREWEVGLGMLKGLTRLDVSHNKLESFPDQLNQCVKLEFLNVGHNNIASVPETLQECPLIDRLDLSHNQLTVLPAGLKQLKKLVHLDVSHNQLKTMPDLAAQKLLETLFLDDNLLEALGREVLHSPVLRTLSCNRNQVRKVDGKVKGMATLQSLQLDDNLLKQVPPEVCTLSKLQELSVSGNHLTRLPKNLNKMFQLKQLRVARNALTTVEGGEIAQLISLRQLDLSHNQLPQLPDEFGRLTAAEQVDVSHNHLRALPRIAPLGKLRALDASHNRLRELPGDIDALTSLEDLWLQQNDLTAVPLPALTTMTHLKRLKLKFNQFPASPALLPRLPLLQAVDLSACPLNDDRTVEVTRGKLFKPFFANAAKFEKGNPQDLDHVCRALVDTADFYYELLQGGTPHGSRKVNHAVHFYAGAGLVQQTGRIRSKALQLGNDQQKIQDELDVYKTMETTDEIIKAVKLKHAKLEATTHAIDRLRSVNKDIGERAEDVLNKSEDLLHQARTAGPGLEVYYCRAASALARGEPPRAITDLTRVIEGKHGHDPSCQMLAEARETLGQYSQAKRDCMRAARAPKLSRADKELQAQVSRRVTDGIAFIERAGVDSSDKQRVFSISSDGVCHRRGIDLKRLITEGSSKKRAMMEERRQRKHEAMVEEERDEFLVNKILDEADSKRERISASLKRWKAKRLAEQEREEEEARRKREERKMRKELERKQAEERREARELEGMRAEEKAQRKFESDQKAAAAKENQLAEEEEEELEALLRSRGKGKKKKARSGVTGDQGKDGKKKKNGKDKKAS